MCVGQPVVPLADAIQDRTDVTVRTILKCDVCGSTTMVRTQIGWLSSHPIRVHCGECNILISGTLTTDRQTPSYKLSFANATEVDDPRPRFYVEVSGELLTRKVEPLTTDPLCPYPAPFFESLWRMGNENYRTFKAQTQQFLSLIENEWPRVRRINELWLAGSLDYVRREVWKVLPQDKFPMNNRLECMRGVHNINLLFLKPALDMDRFMATVDFLGTATVGLARSRRTELGNLVDDFADQGLLRQYEARVLHGMTQWVETFPFLIPAFGVRLFYQGEPGDLGAATCGLNTASFEDLKQFFLDTFESSSEMLRLVVAMNNLEHRRDFLRMASRRRDVATLVDFDAKSKGERLQFVDGSEAFDRLVDPPLDNKLRNAIGHFAYRHDGARQVVRYFPSGIEGRVKARLN